jgi:hypothetical protein
MNSFCLFIYLFLIIELQFFFFRNQFELDLNFRIFNLHKLLMIPLFHMIKNNLRLIDIPINNFI